jgi:hypothetical protein
VLKSKSCKMFDITMCTKSLFLNCFNFVFCRGGGCCAAPVWVHTCMRCTLLFLLPTKTDSVGLTGYLVHQMLVVPTTVFLSRQCWLYAWCMLQVFWITKATHKSRLHNGAALHLLHNMQFKKQCLTSYTNLLAELSLRQAYKGKCLVVLVLHFLH